MHPLRLAGFLTFLVVLDLIACRPPTASAAAGYRDGEVIVRFRAGASQRAGDQVHRRLGARVARSFRFVPRLQQVTLPPGVSVEEALSVYMSDPAVEYAEPNYLVEAFDLPDAIHFGDQWGLHNTGQDGGTRDADIDAAEAWDIETGDPSVVIGIIDSGIDYDHPDLAPSMFGNPGECTADGLDDDGNGHVDDCYGIDTYDEDSDPSDAYFHGTHVAGIVAGAGVGVAGVARNTSLMACKFLGANRFGHIADAIACFEYFGDLRSRGVNVVATNNSWGSAFPSVALRDAVAAQREAGILTVAAAGNSGNDIRNYPAGYEDPGIVSVAATTRDDAMAFFSSFGAFVDIGAPGFEIISTVPENAYQLLSGTSMAAPHVAGVAALLAAQDPSRNWSAIRNLLLSSGDPLASLARTVTGRRLNARRALTCTDDEITLRMRPDDTSIVTGVGNAMALSVTHVRCADAAGSVSVSVAPGAEVVELADDGTGADHAAGDGTYSALWTPAAAGTYTLSFAGGDEVQVAARTGVVQSPSPATSSDFGHAMAADAQRVLIGAPDEAHAGIDAGAAHLFDAGSGALLRSYHDPGAASGNGFGTAVALHDDLVMIGAPLHDAAEEDEGAAYLFDAATGELLHELANPAPAAADRFGRSVAIMDTTLFVGAPFDDATGTESGRGYLFDRTTGTLLAAIEDPTPFDLEALGYAAAGAGGTVIVSTAYDDDVEYDERQANLKVYDAHAESEGLGSMLFAFDQADEGSGNGFRVAAGRAISVWEDLTVSSYPDISAQDLNSVLSQSIRGAAVFETATGQLIGSLRHAETPGAVAGDEFGTSVAVRDRWAVVGAPGADSAYLFDARTGDLRRSMSLGQTGHNSRFGQSVGVTQDVVFVAASRADSIQQDAGQAYSFPLPPVRGAMKCYRAEGRSPERALHTAADPVGDFSFAPVATRGLCTGARHGRFANADEERRAVCYGARATSQALLPRTIRYRDMLGLRDISLKKLTEICVPAQIDAPPSPFLDRYTCYKSRRAPGTEGFTRRTIDIGDAFEDQSYEILGPEAFCYAATVDGAPPSGPQDHLSCYRVRATAASVFTAPGMSSLDELGTRQLRLKSARSICLPAVVEP